MIALCAAMLLSTAFASTTAIATSSQERQLYSMVNQARGANGKGRLALSDSLSRRAHNHSEQMADSGSLFHSCLECGKRRSPSMAENIGVGGSIGAVHDALMASSGHRENILDSRFDRVGIGVVRRGGRVWVTELFAG